MMRLLFALLAVALCTASAPRLIALGQSEPIRFVAYDVVIDPAGSTLAAWQLRIEDPSGRALLVGVEGGEDPSFKSAPFYDPAALQGRPGVKSAIVLAAFDETDAGPNSPTRVARLHFQVRGDVDPALSVTAEVIASPTGPIAGATASTSR